MEGVILSSWDYIMGPQIERLWFINYNPKLTAYEVPSFVLRDFNISKQSNAKNELNFRCDLKLCSSMCGQLLLGEIDAPEIDNENTSRIYISDLKILISVVFRMKSWIFRSTIKEEKNVILCIGLICSHDAFHFILNNQFTIDRHFRALADALQNVKFSKDALCGEFADNILHVITVLDSLYLIDVNYIQTNSFLIVHDFSASSFLSKAIVSHLQTSGHTIVLGDSEFKIKQIINILSLFNYNKELHCSLIINSCPLKSNVSVFHIQGLVKNSEKDCEYLLEYAYNESLSLTVIDTDLCQVWQTYPFRTSFEKHRVFSPVTEVGCIIPQLLNDISFAHKNDIGCQSLAQNFTKLLMMKAVALVNTITQFRGIKRVLSKQELMNLFTIRTFVDFQIIVGCAEKIKPGIKGFIT